MYTKCFMHWVKNIIRNVCVINFLQARLISNNNSLNELEGIRSYCSYTLKQHMLSITVFLLQF